HALNVKVSRAAAAAQQKNERSEREDFRDAGVVGTAEGAVNHDADVAPFEGLLAIVDKRDGVFGHAAVKRILARRRPGGPVGTDQHLHVQRTSGRPRAPAEDPEAVYG